MKKGFTLIEILVVISIIAILAGIGISVFSGVQKNNRDQARIRDLQAIKQALELYRSDNGDYPVTGNVGVGTTLTNPSRTKIYLEAWPADPINGQLYKYVKASTGTGFVVCAKKEGTIADTALTDCLSAICDTSNTCNIGLQSD